jgi:alpha-L-rhamnosidase
MCKSWLPDSPSVPARTFARTSLILARSVDWLPQPVKIARRHAFRYVRIEVVAVSMHYGVRWVSRPSSTPMLSYQLWGDCVAAAARANLYVGLRTPSPTLSPRAPPLSFASAGSEISDEDKTVLRRIDEVALRTLRNCMQTVYEDGPRRDMRLW